jgi:hypothetical protein
MNKSSPIWLEAGETVAETVTTVIVLTPELTIAHYFLFIFLN